MRDAFRKDYKMLVVCRCCVRNTEHFLGSPLCFSLYQRLHDYASRSVLAPIIMNMWQSNGFRASRKETTKTETAFWRKCCVKRDLIGKGSFGLTCSKKINRFNRNEALGSSQHFIKASESKKKKPQDERCLSDEDPKVKLTKTAAVFTSSDREMKSNIFLVEETVYLQKLHFPLWFMKETIVLGFFLSLCCAPFPILLCK